MTKTWPGASHRPGAAAKPRIGRRRNLLPVLAGLAVLALAPSPVGAAEPGLHVELNKAEDAGGACLASFVLRNDLGHTLDRFNLDLFIFDREGVIARQVLLDLAPLRGAKTTVVRFALLQRPCAEVGEVLVNDIPSCRAETGEALDCLDGLTVSSRDRIALTK